MLSVPRKVYEKVLTETLMKVTERRVSKKQGGDRKVKGHMDQIFFIKMVL